MDPFRVGQALACHVLVFVAAKPKADRLKPVLLGTLIAS
jgi:hypothetical protein